ncbi:enteropeptidase-like protein [Dinothrombium tinctorium]|uniref:Enteropeptidase-like protein n=1 Tax=Dinothrombium tinctorium TaxID=1965070 RepID=A0A443QG86_9ACAR|nr:enteropeptidase-like protein [Dinothrombium tinctorium]
MSEIKLRQVIVTLLLASIVDAYEFEDEDKIICGRRFGVSQNLLLNNELFNQPNSEQLKGFDVKPGDFPWAANIQVIFAEYADQNNETKFVGQWENYCGAFIIGDEWLVTAANCIHSLQTDDAILTQSVLVGTTSCTNEDSFGTRHNIVAYFLHPHFDNNTKVNNIALIRISPLISFTSGSIWAEGAIWPVCLPAENEKFFGTVTVAGCGFTKPEIESVSRNFMASDYEIQPDIDCEHAFPYIFVRSSMLCAEKASKGSPCFGDEGSALVTLVDGRAHAIGILSHVTDRCSGKAIYTRVSPHVRWIYSLINV